MTPCYDSSICSGALPFTLLTTRLLEDVSFEFDPFLVTWISRVLIDASFQAKHYSRMYGLMVPPTQEALVEEDEVRDMEWDAPIPKS